jgi:hypothetical protein
MQMGLGWWIGILLIVHEIFLIVWGITLINAYVTRRYYLLALGGFEVEQRLIEQREMQLNAMLIIEPDTNPIQMPHNKLYRFQEAETKEEEMYECSICLNKKLEGEHFVDAGCGHCYHEVCLMKWSQVNSNCPQCRTKFKETKPENDKRTGTNVDEYLPHIDEVEDEDALGEDSTKESSERGNQGPCIK